MAKKLSETQRANKDVIQRLRTQRQLQLTSIPMMIIFYIITLGIIQFLAGFANQTVSLQTPVLLMGYALLVIAMFTLILEGDIVAIIENRSIMIAIIIMYILLGYASATGYFFPSLFSIAG